MRTKKMDFFTVVLLLTTSLLPLIFNNYIFAEPIVNSQIANAEKNINLEWGHVWTDSHGQQWFNDIAGPIPIPAK